MFIFRIRVTLNEDQFDSIKKLEHIDNMNDDLKSHIYQQVIEQIKNINSNYY